MVPWLPDGVVSRIRVNRPQTIDNTINSVILAMYGLSSVAVEAM